MVLTSYGNYEIKDMAEFKGYMLMNDEYFVGGLVWFYCSSSDTM